MKKNNKEHDRHDCPTTKLTNHVPTRLSTGTGTTVYTELYATWSVHWGPGLVGIWNLGIFVNMLCQWLVAVTRGLAAFYLTPSPPLMLSQ